MGLINNIKYHLLYQRAALDPFNSISRIVSDAFLSKYVKKYNNRMIDKYNGCPAVFHTHTINSLDGCRKLKDVVYEFCRSGYKIIGVSDHNNIVSDEEWDKCKDYAMNKYDALLVPGVERTFFYQKESVFDKKVLAPLMEVKTLYDSGNMKEIQYNNPNKELLSRDEVIEKIIPEYCNKIIKNKGIVVFPHPHAVDTLPDFVAKNNQTSHTSLWVQKVRSNNVYYNILPTGVLKSDLEKILQRIGDRESVLVEDINPTVPSINNHTCYDKSCIDYQKMRGMFPYFVIPEYVVGDLSELLGINLSDYCMSKDNNLIFDLTTYNKSIRETLVPLIIDEFPEVSFRMNSEILSLHGIFGMDFHGKERRYCGGDIIFLDEEKNIGSVFDALRNKKSFPYITSMDCNPIIKFLNNVMRFTAPQKGIYMQRIALGINVLHKYYYLNDLSKDIQEHLRKEFNIKEENMLVPGYEYFNARILKQNGNL